jgi:excisionase family DNA binding protein
MSTGIGDAERKLGRPAVGYTVREVSEMLRISKNAVYDMISRNECPAVKVGRLLRIPARPFHEKFGDINPV